jgi:signal transduction histidine kinase
VESLNHLFDRVRASLEGERRFTADAAHELRTPLAALRAQAQVALGAIDADERRRALEKVMAGCDRASHLVSELLTLARLEPREFRAEAQPCALGGVLEAALAEVAPAAIAKDIELGLDAPPEPVTIAGDARLLDMLFRNIVDNAVRYSPPRSRVTVRLARRGQEAVVVTNDEGPGVPQAQREMLGARFRRFGGSDAPGTGLGLSIARRIAELHRGTISFGDGEGGRGLAVTVALPLQATRAAT